MLVKNIETLPSFLAGDHTLIKEVLHPSNDPIQMSYSLAHATLPVGDTSLPHLLEASEVYIILEGEGHLVVNDESTQLGAGDVVFIPAFATQYISNIGKSALKFLCIVDPPWAAEKERLIDQ